MEFKALTDGFLKFKVLSEHHLQISTMVSSFEPIYIFHIYKILCKDHRFSYLYSLQGNSLLSQLWHSDNLSVLIYFYFSWSTLLR